MYENDGRAVSGVCHELPFFSGGSSHRMSRLLGQHENHFKTEAENYENSDKVSPLSDETAHSFCDVTLAAEETKAFLR